QKECWTSAQRTFVHWASRRGWLAVLNLMRRGGVGVDELNACHEGLTAFQYAKRYGVSRIVNEMKFRYGDLVQDQDTVVIPRTPGLTANDEIDFVLNQQNTNRKVIIASAAAADVENDAPSSSTPTNTIVKPDDDDNDDAIVLPLAAGTLNGDATDELDLVVASGHHPGYGSAPTMSVDSSSRSSSA
ncbi:unnamed protein product, partial [Notodromas monacha]